MLMHLFVCFFLLPFSVLPCIAQREFIFGFQESKRPGSSYSPVGRVYLVNPGTVTATVRLSTPLISSGAAAVSEIVTLGPSSGEYVTVPYDIHTVGSQIENKGLQRGVLGK